MNTTVRHETRYRGVRYRLRQDGTRAYCVYANGTWTTIEGGEKDALAAQAKLREQTRKGARVTPTRMTVCTLAEEWLQTKARVSLSTADCHRRNVKLITRHLGDVKVKSLSLRHVRVFLAVVQTELSPRTGRPLAPGTLKNTLNALKQMLTYAVEEGYCAENVTAHLKASDRPRGGASERRALRPDEIHALLAACANRPDMEAIMRVGFATGARVGEVCGLRWEALDLRDVNAATIRIMGQFGARERRWKPWGKTDAALRTINIDRETALYLRAYRERAFARGTTAPEAYVFQDEHGHIHPQRVHRCIQQARKGQWLAPDVIFHLLRHTFASRLIGMGLPVTYIAQQLGHANPAVTLDTYSHFFRVAAHETQAREALADLWAEVAILGTGNVQLNVQ